MKIAIIGVTGVVGKTLLQLLPGSNLTISSLLPVASIRSIGKKISYNQTELEVIGIEECLKLRPNIAFFAAGSKIALEWAPKFSAAGCFCIDKSSAFRMQDGIPLVIPEINQHTINEDTKIIASPNCSTSQLVLALEPLRRAYGLERVVVSTYQSVSGSGAAAVQQYQDELEGKSEVQTFYPHKILANCIPHCDVFLEDGFTKEERKLEKETQKILGLADLKISATAVRVPVVIGHSESVNVELKTEYEIKDVISSLEKMDGVKVVDDPQLNKYPMPINAAGDTAVFVGRIRRDQSANNALWMWVVSDNLLKGAASNAIQIAEVVADL